MVTAYLSLGSNLGDRRKHLESALRLLPCKDLRITRVSSVYETAPLDLTDQPGFLNIAAAVETTLKPATLLKRTAHIEETLGRERAVPKGPRTIDIDILLYGGQVIETPTLEVPHPRMNLRQFVLKPLAEIAPDTVHPVAGLTISQLLALVPEQGVRKIAGPFGSQLG